MIYRTVTIKAKITDSVVAVTPALSGNISVNADIITKVRSTNYEEYSGSYEVTPSEEIQTLQTEDKVLLFKGSGTNVSYYVGYYTSSSSYAYGLLANTKYQYIAVYSS